MAGERSPCARRDPFTRVRVKVRDPFPRSQEGLSCGGVSPHPRETGRRVGGLLQLLAVAVLVRRASGLGAVVGAAAVASMRMAVAVAVGGGFRRRRVARVVGMTVRVAVHLVPVAICPVDGDQQSRQFGWLLEQGGMQGGDERCRHVVIRGHRRYVDHADGGRPHSSGEPAGPCPLRDCQQPLLGQLRVLVLLDDVDEQVADAEEGEPVQGEAQTRE